MTVLHFVFGEKAELWEREKRSERVWKSGNVKAL